MEQHFVDCWSKIVLITFSWGPQFKKKADLQTQVMNKVEPGIKHPATWGGQSLILVCWACFQQSGWSIIWIHKSDRRAQVVLFHRGNVEVSTRPWAQRHQQEQQPGSRPKPLMIWRGDPSPQTFEQYRSYGLISKTLFLRQTKMNVVKCSCAGTMLVS